MPYKDLSVRRERGREYNQKNRERIREHRREYYQKNREKIFKQRREYDQKNREKISERKREYEQKNREKIFKRRREYRQRNRENISEHKREYYQKNREKIREQTREHYQKNRERMRDRRLRRAFGISAEDYQEMLTAQEGKCDICKVESLPGRKAMQVDHSHATGRVRGLLCGACNSCIGMVNDSVEILQSAIEYLTKHK